MGETALSTIIFDRSPFFTSKMSPLSFPRLTPGGGGNRHMKGVGMLVVSLSGVNFGFWSRLGCSGQNAIIFSPEGVV